MTPWRLAALLALAPAALAAQGKSAPAARWAPKGPIAVGATVRDSLARGDVFLPGESAYAQEWRFLGRAGATVTIDVVSDAFDAYVFLLGPGLSGVPPQDDDSGGHCNARLTVRLPRTGDYFIVVTSTDKLAVGRFTLTLTAGAKPVSLMPCPR